MNIFETHSRIIKEYRDYIESFIRIKDERIRGEIHKAMENGILMPDPLIQFNPSFKFGAELAQLCDGKFLHKDIARIFKGYKLYQHQVDALKLGAAGRDFIVTSGTGSGKSLTYIGTIFNHILSGAQSGKGIKAIVVYPMNALINSQTEEFKKYQIAYLKDQLPSSFDQSELEGKTSDETLATLEKQVSDSFPVTFAQYTGQEKQEVRERIKQHPPDILLTNYMMLELMMTRRGESPLRDAIKEGLKFLVFDELHTYRGRQGADVAMLIRRIKAYAGRAVQCIGTSATMASGKGDLEDQKQEVANVGQLIFGVDFNTEQIINESLERVTNYPKILPSQSTLQQAIQTPIDLNAPEEVLKEHALAIWLENRIGLEELDGWLKRRAPCTFQEMVEQLGKDTGSSEDLCDQAIKNLLDWSAQVNDQLREQGIRRAYFPFRLHQFISQTGSVYVTLESCEERKISLHPGHFIRTDKMDKQRIYQTVFSRITGHEFICVRKNFNKHILEPRDFKETFNTDESLEAGYLIPQYPDDEGLWSRDLIESLPDAWVKDYAAGLDVIPKYRNRVPTKVYYDEEGNFSEQPSLEGSQWAWYMPAKLLFDPTAGAFYNFQTSESAKLMRLGNEGRSTATTTLALGTIKALAGGGLPPGEQKLLSFTDNRQDASLQSGHFNDFMNIGRIRSAIYHALEKAPGNQLTVDMIADYVIDCLNLPQEEYARSPATFAGRMRENREALKEYLTIRVFEDLKRGWRYTMPNLEQCALLDIRYKYLEDEINNPAAWEGIPELAEMNTEVRRKFLLQTLDYIRTSNAIHHRYFFQERRSVESRIKDKLKDEWCLGPDERIESPNYLRYEPIGRIRGYGIHTASAGKTSAWGKFVGAEIGSMNTEAFIDFAGRFFGRLEEIGFLTSEELKGDNGETRGYLLNSDIIIWAKGDYQAYRPDEVRIRTYMDPGLRTPNAYFQQFYMQDFAQMKPIRGREHTGQIKHDDRVEREGSFRKGELSALFCSPTMELGIDISNLNIVHMRNVPPSPANYAQRSGRAGRSGQGALVITYCSQYSPHDRNYFAKQQSMVSGTVVPPRISLQNEELLRSHINAIYLLETGLDFNRSITEVLDLDDAKKLPIKADTWVKIIEQHDVRKKRVLAQVMEILQNDRALTGYLDLATIETIIDEVPTQFQQAFDRWRTLYHNADHLKLEARRTIDNPHYTSQSDERKQADRNERFAKNQLEALRNDGSTYSFSEFYPFRYLASEGFLPGYNFTKLPLRTAINGYTTAEYISRPRLIAIREFGPRNIIYHNGQSYLVNRIQTTDIQANLVRAKVAQSSGYFLTGEEYSRETCPITGESLANEGGEVLTSLMEMTETSTVERQRISCEEEERMSTGYDIKTYFSLPDGPVAKETIIVKSGNDKLLEIYYMPTAKIVQVNKSWRRSNRDQFIVDKVTGFWKKESDMEKDEEGRIINVSLYTDYTTNALYIQPMKALGISAEGVLTLQYALKRAIEEVYQVESREIGATPMGSAAVANIMLYEASEGSLGVLGQMATAKREFHRVIRRAYELCHFAKGEDQKPELGPASYEDLLSYYNQRYHEQIDRYQIKEVLESLLECEIEIKGSQQVGEYEEQYQHLLDTYDKSSATEADFLKFLYQRGLRLPDKAQPMLGERYGLLVQPDFQYDKHIFVFCDGTPHDDPDVRARDRAQRTAMKRKGLRIISWHYQDDLEALVETHKDVFVKVK